VKLHIVTIVLDGMPFITWHYPILRQLKLDWHWWVVQGVAWPEKCTSWCAQIEPRLSRDGTDEYLSNLARFDPRITHLRRTVWPGKVTMFNEALGQIDNEEYLLLQADSDEIWTKRQLEKLHDLLLPTKLDNRNCAFFRCNYFVGPNLVITSRHGFGNRTAYEWKRAWRVQRGVLFETHEPPKLIGFEERSYWHDDTEALRLVFDHFSWCTEAQVAFKSVYYNSLRNPNGHLYKNLLQNWKNLQLNTEWPARLKTYFPFVDDDVIVDKI